MISFLSESNSGILYCSGILNCLLLVNHRSWKSIEQRIAIIQFRGYVGMNLKIKRDLPGS